jgi:thiol:disulfide interchange protein
MAKPSQPDSVKTLAKDLVVYGLGFSIPVAAITFVISVLVGQWLWVIAAVPATVALVVVIGLVARLGSRHTSPMSRRMGGIVVQVGKVVGLLVGLAAGVALIWFGIQVNRNASTCDPQVSHCVAVVNGVARGNSTESVGSQRFGTFLPQAPTSRQSKHCSGRRKGGPHAPHTRPTRIRPGNPHGRCHPAPHYVHAP